ncbi:MAG TPA: DUF2163 domain-containing protein [Mesorhizobium sp.]|jgi:uncharacterized phage protein (TIGR02218 family)|nr:DUF2163 domain-containing protein [Mesorhizobium sp.]
MSTYPPELAAHLAREVTTVCHCWALQPKEGAALGFTEHDRALEFEGVAFEPDTGLVASEARRSIGLSTDAMDVEGALSSATIGEEDISSGRFDDAEVTCWLVNWRAPAERTVIRRAVLGRIARRDGRFWAELKSLAHPFDRPGGRFVARRCDAELGDERCRAGVGGAAFNGAGAVLADEGLGLLRVSGLGGFAAGWFAQGRLTWASGERAGQAARVREHRVASGAVHLLLEEAVEAAVGEAFTVRAGCDKRFATCKQKFSNSINFRGFPHLPGNDAAYAYVSEEAVFDGAPLVR